MNNTESAIQIMKEEGHSTQAIIDALCDGEALESMGLNDTDQEDIEVAYESMKAAEILDIHA